MMRAADPRNRFIKRCTTRVALVAMPKLIQWDFSMKHRAWVVTAILSFSSVLALAAHAADCKAISGKLLDNLDHGNYAVAGADFDEEMKTLTPERLKIFWQGLPKKWGVRGARDDARLVQKNGNDIVVTPLHFGDRVANAVVVCSVSGQISGFHVVPQQ